MSALKIEVCRGQAGLALYVDDVRQAGVRHNGAQETILRADYSLPCAEAAPDMLAALKAMLPEANQDEAHCRPSFETCEIARAAIAKAEGRS